MGKAPRGRDGALQRQIGERVKTLAQSGTLTRGIGGP
jgi:hypothetical protein